MAKTVNKAQQDDEMEDLEDCEEPDGMQEEWVSDSVLTFRDFRNTHIPRRQRPPSPAGQKAPQGETLAFSSVMWEGGGDLNVKPHRWVRQAWMQAL